MYSKIISDVIFLLLCTHVGRRWSCGYFHIWVQHFQLVSLLSIHSLHSLHPFTPILPFIVFLQEKTSCSPVVSSTLSFPNLSHFYHTFKELINRGFVFYTSFSTRNMWEKRNKIKKGLQTPTTLLRCVKSLL